MAGYTRIYCIGGLGGFDGADGISPIHLQIWQGDGNRRWYEPHYFKAGLRPLGDIKTLIPAGPDDPDALLDACLAFFPEAFSSCPSRGRVAEQLRGVEALDLGAAEGLRQAWASLREEARSVFSALVVYAADLKPIER